MMKEEGLRFYDPKDKLPELNKAVLIKYKTESDYEDPGYYICRLVHFDELDSSSPLKFEEFGGEHYAYWSLNEVEGWLYAEQLDCIPFAQNTKYL